MALPGAYLAARARGVPFVLWATVWAHPRTPAHALSVLPTRHLYRHADAVATYGPHVTRHVERHRTRGNVVVAPQAVDVAHYGAPVAAPAARSGAAAREAREDDLLVLFVGRLEREKGVGVLLDAWRRAGLSGSARLAIAGDGLLADTVDRAGDGVHALGHVGAGALPALYAAADVLVLPSIRTQTFLEPWGLVANEAMLQGTPVIASDAVGAVAGGLVRDGTTGLVFPAGDAAALAARLRALHAAPQLRLRLGEAAREAAAELTPAAWAAGMAEALDRVGSPRSGVLASLPRSRRGLIRARDGSCGLCAPSGGRGTTGRRLCSQALEQPRPSSSFFL